MKVKKGYTLVELVVVLIVSSLILKGGYDLFGSMFRQYDDTFEKGSKPTQILRVINTVEDAVTGCSSVEVNPQMIEITSSKGLVKISADDFPGIENLVFAKIDNTVVISVGGDQYCIPILLEV